MILLKRKPVCRVAAALVAAACLGSLAWTAAWIGRQLGGGFHRDTERALADALGVPVQCEAIRQPAAGRVEFCGVTLRAPGGERVLLTCPHALWDARPADGAAGPLLTLEAPRLRLAGPDWPAGLTEQMSRQLAGAAAGRMRIRLREAAFYLPLRQGTLLVEQADGELAIDPSGPWRATLRCGRVNGLALAAPAELSLTLRASAPSLLGAAGLTGLAVPGEEGERFSGSLDFVAGEDGASELRLAGRLRDPSLAAMLGCGGVTRRVRGCDLRIDDLHWANGQLADAELAGRIELKDCFEGEGHVDIRSLVIGRRRLAELILGTPEPAEAQPATGAPASCGGTSEKVSDTFSPKREKVSDTAPPQDAGAQPATTRAAAPAAPACELRGVSLAELCRALGLGEAGGRIDLAVERLTLTDRALGEMQLDVRSAERAGEKRFMCQPLLDELNTFFAEGPVLLPPGSERATYEPVAIRVLLAEGQVRFSRLDGAAGGVLLRVTVPNLFEPELWPTFSIRQDGDPPLPVPLGRARQRWLAFMGRAKLSAGLRELLDLPGGD